MTATLDGSDGRSRDPASSALIAEVESAWRTGVGPDDWDRLRALLVTTATRGPA